MLPPTVTVLGAGSWGTALAILLCRNIERVVIWGRNGADLADMAEYRLNRRYLQDCPLPENLEIQPRFDLLAESGTCYVVVVPSHAFRETLEKLQVLLSEKGISPESVNLVWGTKGFDSGSGGLLSEVAVEILGETSSLGVVSGPSFAGETAKSLPTALTVASSKLTTAQNFSAWFRTPTTRVYFNQDVVGVQLGGAIKNVMAIAAGISDGLGYGANARAALITRGLSELTRLGIAMGGKQETFMGLTGVGDLILTCTDNQSRNRRFGLGLGEGKTMDTVSTEIGQEIEGVNTVRELYEISRKAGVDMPITCQVYQILYEGKPPVDAVNTLLQRNPKSES